MAGNLNKTASTSENGHYSGTLANNSGKVISTPGFNKIIARMPHVVATIATETIKAHRKIFSYPYWPKSFEKISG